MDHENRMRGDAEFARWYTTHHDRIRSLCARILRDDAAGEDLAQETLLKAWTRRESIREEDVGAWLTVVARNLCISYMRRHGRVIPTDAMPEVPDASGDPLANVERLESRRAVRRALREISERQRRALYLHEVNGADYEEIGQEFGLSSEGVRSIAFRARRVVRARLAAAGEGLGAWVFGIRIRLDRWSRGDPAAVDSAAAGVFQAAVSVVLILGLSSGLGSSPRLPSIGTSPSEVNYLSGRSTDDGAFIDSSATLRGPSADTDRGVVGRKSIRQIRDEHVTVERGSDWELRVPGPDGQPLLVIGQRTEPDDNSPYPYEGSKRQQLWDVAVERACTDASAVCDEIFSD